MGNLILGEPPGIGQLIGYYEKCTVQPTVDKISTDGFLRQISTVFGRFYTLAALSLA